MLRSRQNFAFRQHAFHLRYQTANSTRVAIRKRTRATRVTGQFIPVKRKKYRKISIPKQACSAVRDRTSRLVLRLQTRQIRTTHHLATECWGVGTPARAVGNQGEFFFGEISGEGFWCSKRKKIGGHKKCPLRRPMGPGTAYLVPRDHFLLFQYFHGKKLFSTLQLNQINASHASFAKNADLLEILWALEVESGLDLFQ